MKWIISLIQKLGTKKLAMIIISALEVLVKKTDNTVDDQLLQMIKDLLNIAIDNDLLDKN